RRRMALRRGCGHALEIAGGAAALRHRARARPSRLAVHDRPEHRGGVLAMAPVLRRRPRVDPGLTPEQREARPAELRARRRARQKVLARRSVSTVLGVGLLVAVVAWWLLATLGGRDFLLAQVQSRLPAGTELSWGRA